MENLVLKGEKRKLHIIIESRVWNVEKATKSLINVLGYLILNLIMGKVKNEEHNF